MSTSSGEPLSRNNEAISTNVRKHRHSTLVKYLSRTKIPEFAGELADIKMLSTEIRVCFSSMDSNVSLLLQVEFLLQHLHEPEPDQCDLFKHVLRKYKIPPDHCHNFFPVTEIVESGRLNESHVRILVEILADYAFKWELIGVLLDIKSGKLNNIAESSLRSTEYPMIALIKMITEWINVDEMPTLKKLKEALQSKTVGLGDIASNLEEEFNTKVSVNLGKRKPSLKEQPNLKRLKVASTQAHLVHTEIHEKVSFLLEASASSETDTYQWFCDDQELTEGEKYLGTDRPILCIRESSIDISGSIFKCLMNSGSEPAVFVKLKVTCILDDVKGKVCGIYLAEPEVPLDSWPPIKTDIHINLSLVKRATRNVSNSFLYTIKGDMDDILRDKEHIELDKLLNNFKSNGRLLIEGRPGSGKTSVVHEASKQWAKGRFLCRFKLVLLVPLRLFFNLNCDIKTDDILNFFYESKETREKILKFIEENNGQGVCFIFDGLDEYSIPSGVKVSYFIRLFSKKILPKSAVIITSRPVATEKFTQHADQRIEVIGFKRKEVFEYVKKYQLTPILKEQQLKVYLETHYNILHMCYLPIHMNMLLFMYDQCKKFLIETETELYREFTLLTILREMKKSTSDSMESEDDIIYIESINDLEENYRKEFLRVCELAFSMTVSQKLVHIKDDKKDVSLGLITIDRICARYGMKSYCTFLHLTLQEYLAAYHISNMETGKQLEVIKHYGSVPYMEVTWKFYCGILKDKFVDSNKMLETCVNALFQEQSGNVIFQILCIFELQQPSLFRPTENNLLFRDRYFNSYDFDSLGYVLNHGTKIDELVFDSCSITSEGIDTFMNRIDDLSLVPIKTLCFYKHGHTEEQLKAINIFVKNLETLECLDMSETDLGIKHLGLLTPLEHQNLREIKFKEMKNINMLSRLEKGLEKFARFTITIEALPEKEVIRKMIPSEINYIICGGNTVELCDFVLTEESRARTLYSNMINWNVCINISLSHNRIGNSGACGLAEGLQRTSCKSLKRLTLNHNCIGDEGILSLMAAVCSCSELEHLDLGHNSFGPAGVQAIWDAIHHCKELEGLTLSGNKINDDGADIIANALKGLNNLHILNLWSNDITSVGAGAMARQFSNCFHLQKLNFGYNKIDTKGAKEVINSLPKPDHTTLNLEHNENIDPDGVRELAKNLKIKLILQQSIKEL